MSVTGTFNNHMENYNNQLPIDMNRNNFYPFVQPYVIHDNELNHANHSTKCLVKLSNDAKHTANIFIIAANTAAHFAFLSINADILAANTAAHLAFLSSNADILAAQDAVQREKEMRHAIYEQNFPTLETIPKISNNVNLSEISQVNTSVNTPLNTSEISQGNTSEISQVNIPEISQVNTSEIFQANTSEISPVNTNINTNIITEEIAPEINQLFTAEMGRAKWLEDVKRNRDKQLRENKEISMLDKHGHKAQKQHKLTKQQRFNNHYTNNHYVNNIACKISDETIKMLAKIDAENSL
jgi:hypothetical protein